MDFGTSVSYPIGSKGRTSSGVDKKRRTQEDGTMIGPSRSRSSFFDVVCQFTSQTWIKLTLSLKDEGTRAALDVGDLYARYF